MRCPILRWAPEVGTRDDRIMMCWTLKGAELALEVRSMHVRCRMPRHPVPTSRLVDCASWPRPSTKTLRERYHLSKSCDSDPERLSLYGEAMQYPSWATANRRTPREIDHHRKF
eukprot:526150-Rhodomonas_salina.3